MNLEEKKAKFPRKHAVLGMFDILPDDVDDDLKVLAEKIEAHIMEKFSAYIESYHLQDVAYGLQKIVAKSNMPEDIQGGTEPMEESIMENITGLQRIECTMVSRT